VGQAVAAVKAAGAISKEAKKALDDICKLTDDFRSRSDALARMLEHANGDGTAEKHARYFRDKVVPAMAALRETADALECIIPHDLWPLPTYREMLFIK
jgi:glutamine synthetase